MPSQKLNTSKIVFIMGYFTTLELAIVVSLQLVIWRRRSSVGRCAGLVIERLQNLGLTPDAVARRCVLGKDT